MEGKFMAETRIIVGLGNPGREYRKNRHNIGFMVIDALAKRLNSSLGRVHFQSLISTADYLSNKLILAKPQTYMNLSGQAVASLIRFYKVPLTHFLVANDDLDLPFGTIRIRPMGGSGGQRGVNSIIEYLGTREFQRLRLGIGHPPGHMDAADYVLKDFNKDEEEMLPEFLERAVNAILLFSESGLNSAMNKFNG